MKRAGRHAFTLVEVVVAVALLGVGVAACVACIATATRAAGVAGERTAVQLLAQEKLAEIHLRGAADGEDRGDFGPERPGFAWETRARTDPETGLQCVRLAIRWGDPERPRHAEVSTLVRRQAPTLLQSATSPCERCHGSTLPQSAGRPSGGQP